MNQQEIFEEFEDCPIIAAIKDEDGLKRCLTSEIKIVFVLYGDICNIAEIVEQLKNAGKIVMVHIDLIHGLSSREISVNFLKNTTKMDGIISTKPSLIKQAKELGLFTIMRFFVIDSMAFENIEKQVEMVRPKMIEILPGVMPKVISKICKQSKLPLIAGGLISDKEDIVSALNAGAIAVSTTNQKVWFM